MSFRSGRRARRSHASLVRGIARCAGIARDPDRLAAHAPGVSGWSVAEHFDHLILAETGILGWIEGALDDPPAEPGGGVPNRTGRLVLLTGWIPRGRGRAPEQTIPGPRAQDELQVRLADLAGLAGALEPRLPAIQSSGSRRAHPVLGTFTSAQWLRFLDVHHRHHEKIIRDIERA